MGYMVVSCIGIFGKWGCSFHLIYLRLVWPYDHMELDTMYVCMDRCSYYSNNYFLYDEIHIYIKDKVIFDILINNWHPLIHIQYIEGWLECFELIVDEIIPDSVSIILIKLVGLVNNFRHTNAKIVGTFTVPRLNLGYNLVSFSEHIWNPPLKSRIRENIFCNRILCCNNGVSLFEILWWSTECLPTFPFD